MIPRIATLVGMLILAASSLQIAAVSSGGTSGCTATISRPCYDKTKQGSVSILGKNAANTFKACMGNSAPNETGIDSIQTKLCASEQISYAYCFEGKSKVYMREFTGFCNLPPPPPPPPPPAACADGQDNDGDSLTDYPNDPGCVDATDSDESNPPPQPKAFRVVSPNGGESLAFGSSFPIRWEGGDSSWPVNLAIISGDGSVVRRGLVWGIQNDGVEDWIVDLPPGSYKMYAHGCPDGCASTAWDYGDGAFTVTSSGPLSKINSDFLTNKTMVVLSPSGNESWVQGSTHDVIWTGASDNSNIDVYLIDYLANKTYSVIVNGSSNSGKYSWTIPPTVPPGWYTVYISCTSNCPSPYGWYAYSYNPFSIVSR